MSQQPLYDEIPYTSFPYAATHPDRLATVAFLFGVQPPDPLAARVLELGCGAGTNLIAIAQSLPEAHAIGVDLSPTAIEQASATAASLGLSNVAFQLHDIRDLVNGELGEFDYVIAHGVYTWIDPPARAALLSACRAHLKPRGIAYVSFNSHPGGHLRRALRELALWDARGAAAAGGRAERARALFAGLRDQLPGTDAWGALVQRELLRLSTASTDSLVHDLLNDDWDPVWLAEFASQAADHGLAYVGDASFERLAAEQAPDLERALWQLARGDRIAYEQLLDFVLLRRFHDAVLCSAGTILRERLDRARVRALRFRPTGPPGDAQGPAGALLAALARHAPLVVPFSLLADELPVAADELVSQVMDLAASGELTMHLAPPPLGCADVPHPSVSRLARHQALDGSYCTTLFGDVIKVDGTAIRVLLTLADGTRDRDQLLTELAAAGVPMMAREQLDAALRDLAAMALLEPEPGRE
jgi:SAM-dependent methyltransferase